MRSQILDYTESNAVTEECKKTIDSFDWCDGSDVWENEGATSFESAGQTLVNEDDLSNRISLLSCNKLSSTEAKSESLLTATAEIEDDEEEMVTSEMPLAAQTDLAALMHQVTPMPQVNTMLSILGFYHLILHTYSEYFVHT